MYLQGLPLLKDCDAIGRSRFTESFSSFLIAGGEELSPCTRERIQRLYAKFKDILDSSTSQINLKVKIKLSKEAAFAHPTVYAP